MPVMIMLLQKLPLMMIMMIMLVMIMMMTIMLIPVQEFRLLTEVSTCNSAVLFSLGLCFWRSLVSSVYEFLKAWLAILFKKPRSVAQRRVASDFC